MKTFKLTALVLNLVITFTTYSQSYKKLHKKAIVVDTHNDVMIDMLEGKDIATDLTGKTHSDLTRFKKGGIDAQFFSIWSDETYGKGNGFNYAMRQIDTLYANINRHGDKMMLARTPSEILTAAKNKKLASLIGVEGGHMIDDNLGNLETLFNRGTRYMTLTWNNSTSWATSAADETAGKIPNAKKGLNDFGKQVVRRMNELGMMVDLSHVGEQTFWDAISSTTKPVLISHSCVYSICPVPRNLKDDQIKAVAKNGGVIQMNFYSGFLDPGYDKRNKAFVANHKSQIDSLVKAKTTNFDIEKWIVKTYPQEAATLRPPLSILIDHIDYITKLVGVDYVGLGSDFDGISSAPQQLNDVSNYPLITKSLLEKGYSKKDIKKILGGNFMRVFKANTKKQVFILKNY
jgi:membrane dipeptidase